MDAFEAIADPVRRSILESLRSGPRSAGLIAGDFAISRPAVSRHLRVLRDADLVRVETSGRMRVYGLVEANLAVVAEWLELFSGAHDGDRAWERRLDALETEVRRTGRDRRRASALQRAKEETA